MASGSGNVGRPRLQVDVEEVAEMRKIGISITKISEIIGVSRSTLYRALEGSNLIGVTDISNQELDEVLSSYHEVLCIWHRFLNIKNYVVSSNVI